MDNFKYSEPVEHAKFIISGLNEARTKYPNLCDFIIVVEDKEFPCHKNILCLFSDYFKALIEGGFKESTENIIFLKGKSEHSISAVLNFIYTGTLTLDQNNAVDLLQTATALRIDKVVQLCIDYIIHQIDHTNCLEILKLARIDKHETLETSARLYLNHHLCSVFQYESSENEIDFNDVIEMLKDPESHRQGEESVALAIMTWLQKDLENRRPHVDSLLSYINWRNLPAPFLLKVLLRHSLVVSDDDAKELVLKHVRLSYDQQSEMVKSLIKSDDDGTIAGSYRTYRPRKVPHQAVLLVGGLSLGEAERGDVSQPNLMCYHPVERSWKRRTSWPERGLRGFSVTRFNDNVIVTGGCATTINKHVVINRAWLFDVTNNKWSRLPDMNKQRAFHSSCQLNCQLYVVGGSSTTELQVEHFDQFKTLWIPLKKSAPRMMHNFTASACNSKLIVLGNGHSPTLFIQCYNPAIDNWTFLRSPNAPRHLSAPVCVTSPDESKIYVTGDNTKKMYIFDPNSNSWSRASDMNNLHSNGNLVIIGDDVVLTGGHWEDEGYWDEMESYDVTKKTWTRRGALPHLWLYHGCVTIVTTE